MTARMVIPCAMLAVALGAGAFVDWVHKTSLLLATSTNGLVRHQALVYRLRANTRAGATAGLVRGVMNPITPMPH